MEGFLCLIYYTAPLTQRVQTEGARQVPLLSPHQSQAEVGTQAEMTTLSPIHDGQNGREEDLHICGSHWLSAPLAFTELEVSVSSSSVPS